MAMEGGPPGTEMTSISFRDQLWLNTFPLDRNLVFDYFALSPFYDRSCNNEQLRMQSIHPLDLSHLSKMTGMEYMLHEVQEPHLFVIRKQKRETPEKVVAISAFYVLDGSIYQAPNIHNVIGSRVMRAVYHISKAFSEAAAKLEKIGYDQESESTKSESKVGDEHKKAMETFDMKEVYRIDQILSAIQRKLPPAPLPPPIMAVNAEATSLARDSGAQYQAPQQQQTTLAATENTAIVATPQQGPPKRMKTER